MIYALIGIAVFIALLFIYSLCVAAARGDG